MNVTLGGNTAGVGALVSTGTLTLAGGNNITLSQNGNAVTISGGAGGGGIALANSQTTYTSGTAHLAVVGGAMTIASTTGQSFRFSVPQTSSLSATGVISISTNGSTINIGAPAFSAGISNIGNILGTSGTASNQVIFAGGNNITLSQSTAAGGNTVTISAASQTIQTQNLHNLTLSGNTAGAMAMVSSGTLTLAGGNNVTLSQNGNAITISAGAGGAGFSAGMSTIGNTSGTSGMASNQLVLAGGNNITLGQSTDVAGNTISISAGAGGAAASGMYFDNMFQQNSVQAISYTSVSTGMFGRLLIQPLAPGNELFPYDMTASTMQLGFSNSGSSAISGAHSSSWYIGIYTRVNSTQLSLANSVMRSYTMSANVSNSASYMGARWLSVHSSQFSSSPVFKAGSRYFFAVLARTSGASYASISLAGMHLGHSVQRSGQMGAAASSHTSFNAWHPFMGVHSLTTHTALPASIANSEINKASAYANFIPQVIFDAGLGVVN